MIKIGITGSIFEKLQLQDCYREKYPLFNADKEVRKYIKIIFLKKKYTQKI